MSAETSLPITSVAQVSVRTITETKYSVKNSYKSSKLAPSITK